MIAILVIAVPISVLWMLVTGRVGPGSFAVGLLVGAGIAAGMRRLGIGPGSPPRGDQLLALAQYVGYLTWNGLRSSIQVARLILRPRIELHTGIVALRTGDTSSSQRLTAFSAHGLNMSPGQLVVDFGQDGTLFVHCIDLEAVRSRLDAEQAARTALLRRILGEAS